MHLPARSVSILFNHPVMPGDFSREHRVLGWTFGGMLLCFWPTLIGFSGTWSGSYQ